MRVLKFLLQIITKYPSEIILFITACILFFNARLLKIGNKIAIENAEISRQTFKIQLLHDLLNEYSSENMQSAIEELERYRKKEHRIGNSKFGIVYHQKYKDMIDVSRIKVSHFYQKLALFHDIGILPHDLIYATWNRSNLRILIRIIIPIEHRFPTYSKETLRQLGRLYKDSKDYE
jgi:hypothetical protein